MVRFSRLAVLICAAAIAAAPGSAKNGVWRTEAKAPATAHAAADAAGANACSEIDRPNEVSSGVARKPASAASFSPQRSQSALRDAAAARLAKLWARG